MRRGLVLSIAMLGMLSATAARAQSMFTHQIPIKMPKGTHGMQPDLALVYTPGAGNGMVGMGWQLTGLSAITRVNQGWGVNFDGGDAYSHSQLGVLVRQGDGSYRSRKESFTKLVPSGFCGDAPCSWTAYDRNGNKFFYGTTADSRIEAPGRSSVKTWALARVEDLFGNAYEATYYEDNWTGLFYPSVVTYTKGPGLSIYRTVTFTYEGRTDNEAGYYAPGSVEQMPVRLKWIQVNSNNVMLRKYRLDYAYGGATGRSLLTAVQEYGSDGTTLPAQTFAWQRGGSAMYGSRWDTRQNSWSYPDNGTFLTGDFDGDGRTDIAVAYNDANYLSIDVEKSYGSVFQQNRWAFRSVPAIPPRLRCRQSLCSRYRKPRPASH